MYKKKKKKDVMAAELQPASTRRMQKEKKVYAGQGAVD